MEHTPLPWQITNVTDKNYLTVSPWRGGIPCIATIEGIAPLADKANAEFIVRACNVHYELLEFIKNIRPFLGNDPEATLHKQADALIAKAEGKSRVS